MNPNAMWETRPCPGCGSSVSVPLGVDHTRLCFACQSWQRVERSRLKAGLAPAIENALGQDDARDAIARAVLDHPGVDTDPRYPEPAKPEPAPKHEPDDYGYFG